MTDRADARWPDFFIAGFPVTGTTTLYHLLQQHPLVYMSPIKEPGFFGATELLGGPIGAPLQRQVDADREALAAYLAQPEPPYVDWRLVTDEADYLRLFSRAPADAIVGEASMTYAWLPGVPAEMAARVPRARIVFLVRDPADRFFSFHVASLAASPRVTLAERFATATDPGHSSWFALNVGRYATHLRRFFDCFPRDQIKVCLHEDFRADPAGVAREVFAHIGVDPAVPLGVTPHHHETRVARLPRLDRWWRRLTGRRPWAGRPLKQSRAARLYYRDRASFTMAPDDRRRIVDYYRDEIEATGALIGRDLSAWLR